jgi:hypothetical protein
LVTEFAHDASSHSSAPEQFFPAAVQTSAQLEPGSIDRAAIQLVSLLTSSTAGWHVPAAQWRPLPQALPQVPQVA